MPPVTEDDIHLASYYASKLKELGQAFTTAERRDEALRDFSKDWHQIKLGLIASVRSSTSSAMPLESA